MITMLKNWQGKVTVNGEEWNKENSLNLDNNTPIHIILTPTNIKSVDEPKMGIEKANIEGEQQYKISVRRYMTKKATPDFDFMAKWNNDIPMPLRVMVGTKVKETKGMVYMKLHGEILEEITHSCMMCGRKITNPVSKFFGLGPECGGHNYTNPFESDEALRQAVESYKLELRKKTWEGWIIKSAIEECVEL